MSATWKNNIEITIFGESHGKGVGVVIGNFPSGVQLDEAFIESEMNRRRPGSSKLGTPRNEEDKVEIMSGVLDGITTGAPIMAMIFNKDTRSHDYLNLKKQMRPGHSDYSAFIKYNGFNDVRGGGHFSGRLTAPIVFVGALCKQVLKQRGIEVVSHVKSVGDIYDACFDSVIDSSLVEGLKSQAFPLINEDLYDSMEQLILDVKQSGDSIGGQVECSVIGLDAGLGEPFFESIESKLATLIFSIPGVKGLHFGNVDCNEMQGSACNDGYCFDGDEVMTTSNHNGGIVGGITNGMPVTFTVSVKPTPSISLEQDSIDVETRQNTKIKIQGRHDPCIVPRAVVVVEAMSAICMFDSVRYL